MSKLKQLPIPDKDVLDTWTDRVATNIDAIILERIEPQLNELGWFKERTCEISGRSNSCSRCGASIERVTHSVVEMGDLYACPPSFCPSCGAKVVEHG